MSDDWTEEKHKSFLNSMEAAFVKELYSNEHGSNYLLSWSSRTQIHLGPIPEVSHLVSLRLCGDYWEKLKFDRSEVQAKNENEFQKLSENPWIQHFKTQASVKDQHLTPADSMDSYNLVDQSVQFIDWRRGREALSSKQAVCSYKLNQLSVDSIAEVSDQNFVDVVEKREKPSRRTGKKRVRKEASPINDQVVPFVALTSDEQGTLVEENNYSGSSTNLAAMGGSSSFQS